MDDVNGVAEGTGVSLSGRGDVLAAVNTALVLDTEGREEGVKPNHCCLSEIASPSFYTIMKDTSHSHSLFSLSGRFA